MPEYEHVTVDCAAVCKQSFNTIVKLLPTYSERELKALLEYEATHQRRKHYIDRIYGRFNKLRSQREREIYMQGSIDVNC